MPKAGWLALVVVIGIGPGCAPPPVFLRVDAATTVDGRAHYMGLETQGGVSHLVELDCAPALPRATEVACVSRRVVLAEPEERERTLVGPEGDAIRAASGCPVASITVQSGDEATGFWLYVCGEQRFFRRNEAGAWIDATP